MAELQYIGARYVPKFFEGTSGSEWIQGVAYEALTIVTRNGNSYTSKIPVPASVGVPESNPTYWVSTGVYNQQVEQYRQEVEALSGDVTEVVTDVSRLQAQVNEASVEGSIRQNWLADKNIFVVGDSLSTIPNNMWLQLKKIVPNANITNNAEGGIATARMIEIVNAADLSTYDVIFVQCCTNDWQSSVPAATFGTNITNIINAVRARNPHIELIFITPPYSRRTFSGSSAVNKNTAGLFLYDYINLLSNICNTNNISMIDVYDYSCCTESTYLNWLDVSTGTEIYVHPNRYLSAVIANLIATRVTVPFIRDQLLIPTTHNANANNVPYIIYNRHTQAFNYRYVQFTYTGTETTADVEIGTIGDIPTGLYNPGTVWLPLLNYTKNKVMMILFNFTGGKILVHTMGGTVSPNDALVFPGSVNWV